MTFGTGNKKKATLTTAEAIAVDTSKTVLAGDVCKLVGKDRNKLQGRNVSGRSWKVRPQKRASSLRQTATNTTFKSWQEKQDAKRLQRQAQELQQELREERRAQKVQKRERRLENERRRMENEFKAASASAQTLNFNKVNKTLKTLSKKQLRQIKKTRLNTKTGVVEYVPAYSK